MRVNEGLWKARGASRQDMIDFWVHYQGMSRAQAQQMVAALNPILQAITAQCGSLNNMETGRPAVGFASGQRPLMDSLRPPEPRLDQRRGSSENPAFAGF